MARPRKHLPPGGVDILREAASNGVAKHDVARRLGLNFRTLERLLKDDPAAREAWAEGKEAERAELVGLLMEKARKGDGASAMFLLKSRHGYRDHGPVDGDAAAPVVNITLPAALSPDQWLRMVNVTPQPRQIEGDSDA